MQAISCTAAHKFELASLPIPEVGDDEVLIKVTACGICGSDKHLLEGAFPHIKLPVVPGHEVVGKVAQVGKDVRGFSEGDRVVIDPTITCGECFYCLRGSQNHCERLGSLGWTKVGGFADHVVASSEKVFRISDTVSDEEATLIEPLSVAIHVLEQLELKSGAEVLVLGAGPSGALISQLCKLNGASRVVLASNKGMKMDVAREVGAAHEYLELDRNDAEGQWKSFKSANPYGFDVVVEATGDINVTNNAINYVRRKGTLCLYGVYVTGQLQLPPYMLVRLEIKLVGAFAQIGAFPRAIQYAENGQINLKGMISHVYRHEDFQEAMDKLNSKQIMKIALKP
ncbi:NADP+-dependent D-mannitol dehydrogenase [Dendrothele bispora CBS 962.96]|uniref:NADP+-dependent D-mannitol dehydrogenase n=1 Tax=Dendrothele bispora (strain CBS 962.96) TaxID=1314807 RepID=A0A4S8L3H9_DENBC|nr:NADP+-dependent D-mannitol dehydrogenase [Dendrothele bispora CBS 962.96]